MLLLLISDLPVRTDGKNELLKHAGPRDGDAQNLPIDKDNLNTDSSGKLQLRRQPVKRKLISDSYNSDEDGMSDDSFKDPTYDISKDKAADSSSSDTDEHNTFSSANNLSASCKKKKRRRRVRNHTKGKRRKHDKTSPANETTEDSGIPKVTKRRTKYPKRAETEKNWKKKSKGLRLHRQQSPRKYQRNKNLSDKLKQKINLLKNARKAKTPERGTALEKTK